MEIAKIQGLSRIPNSISNPKRTVFSGCPLQATRSARRPAKVRYGVMANIAVSHTAARGSIPRVGIRKIFSLFFFAIINY